MINHRTNHLHFWGGSRFASLAQELGGPRRPQRCAEGGWGALRFSRNGNPKRCGNARSKGRNKGSHHVKSVITVITSVFLDLFECVRNWWFIKTHYINEYIYRNWWFAVGVEHRTRYHSSRKVMMTKLTVVHLIAKAVTSWFMLILGHEDFLPGWSGHTKLTLEALRSNQKTQPQRFCRALGRTWKNWRHRNAVKLTLSIPKKIRGIWLEISLLKR